MRKEEDRLHMPSPTLEELPTTIAAGGEVEAGCTHALSLATSAFCLHTHAYYIFLPCPSFVPYAYTCPACLHCLPYLPTPSLHCPTYPLPCLLCLRLFRDLFTCSTVSSSFCVLVLPVPQCMGRGSSLPCSTWIFANPPLAIPVPSCAWNLGWDCLYWFTPHCIPFSYILPVAFFYFLHIMQACHTTLPTPLPYYLLFYMAPILPAYTPTSPASCLAFTSPPPACLHTWPL